MSLTITYVFNRNPTKNGSAQNKWPIDTRAEPANRAITVEPSSRTNVYIYVMTIPRLR